MTPRPRALFPQQLLDQRWRERSATYRPAGEPIRTSEYDVAPIQEDAVARAFVERHHYSGTYPAARERIGLFRGRELGAAQLVGVAVFSHPCADRVLTNVFPRLPVLEAVELGRFVLLDEVPGNGETWFLARAFELLRARGIRGVVSFSDPIARTDDQGRPVFPGHLGTIYQAHNARYLGRGTARSLKLLPDGTVLSARAIQKIRAGTKGWRYAAEQLQAFGAEPLDAAADRGARMDWLGRWMPRLTRDLRHPGNLRYAWPLARRVELAAGGAYPKARAA